MNRRLFLKSSSAPLITALSGVGVLGGLSGLNSVVNAASTGDYKALVCIFLNGGNDGNNTLIPTDGAYNDYEKSRPELALPKNSLIALNGTSAGHSFGLHPALAPLAALYNQQRLAWIANAGPLIVPCNAEQAIAQTVALPPFLGSHSDQTAMQQGWQGDSDASGWAGRALEVFPSALINPLNAVTMDNNRSLVLGKKSRVGFMSPDGARYWGPADLARPQDYWSQAINSIAKWQFTNNYEAEYSRTFGGSVNEATILTKVFSLAKEPQADFASDDLASKLRALAKTMPVFKALGYRRQVFLVSWGGFDTHYGQRGTGAMTQDTQLNIVGKAVAAFDQANRASGLDLDVTSLMMSDFGRTLRPASGGGSDHAWGNHWFVLGGAVTGGQVLGKFPSLVLGGADDADSGRGGRFVPTIATEQVGATLMQWMGLPANSQASVFPNLANFSQKNLNFLRS